MEKRFQIVKAGKVVGYLYAKTNDQARIKALSWVKKPFTLKMKDNRGYWLPVINVN